MYPAGVIGWKLAARIGLPIVVKFQIGYDPEAKVHIGRSVSLKGIHAEGETLEELFENIKAATSDILDIEMNGKQVAVTNEYQEVRNCALA
jgi:hypothetical protein